MTDSVYIYDAVRTPRSPGRAEGSLGQIKPIALAAGLLDALRSRNELDTSEVDDVIFGCVTPINEQASCIAKAAVQFANWDESVAGSQLDRFCASGLEAINVAAAKIAANWDQLIVAGGVESMSRVPMGSNGGEMLADPRFVPQGVAADLIATVDGFTREELDAYAFQSHQRARAALAKGLFDKSNCPVVDIHGRIVLSHDDCIRADSSLEVLASLEPSFGDAVPEFLNKNILSNYGVESHIHHVHTAGNSSAIADGASAILIGSEAKGSALGLTPRARILATAVLATDPIIMLTGPAPATTKCLARANLKVADIDLWEVNEAFSAVPLRFLKELDIDPQITNVNGGAIALGHPLGATGGCLVSTILDELEYRKLKRGAITMCAGGGMGISTILELV